MKNNTEIKHTLYRNADGSIVAFTKSQQLVPAKYKNQVMENYFVDREGNVYSFRKKIATLLSPFDNGAGYMCTTLLNTKTNKMQCCVVSKLIYESFHPKKTLTDDMIIHNINFDRSDNRLCNLELVSASSALAGDTDIGYVRCQKNSRSHSGDGVYKYFYLFNKYSRKFVDSGNMSQLDKKGLISKSNLSAMVRGVTKSGWIRTTKKYFIYVEISDSPLTSMFPILNDENAKKISTLHEKSVLSDTNSES